jgi:sarcosine oxidase
LPLPKGWRALAALQPKGLTLAGSQLVASRGCHYEDSANRDFLIDRHPEWTNTVLIGAGSDHGFKHGPAGGRYAEDLLLGTLKMVEPRFILVSKGVTQAR